MRYIIILWLLAIFIAISCKAELYGQTRVNTEAKKVKVWYYANGNRRKQKTFYQNGNTKTIISYLFNGKRIEFFTLCLNQVGFEEPCSIDKHWGID